MKQIPNLFTLLNLVFGCLAIIFILQTGETLVTQNEGAWVAQLPEKIWWGSVCIGIAAITRPTIISQNVASARRGWVSGR